MVSNAAAGNWEDWKRRRQRWLSASNGHRRELTGCRGSRRIGGWRSGRPAAAGWGVEKGFGFWRLQA